MAPALEEYTRSLRTRTRTPALRNGGSSLSSAAAGYIVTDDGGMIALGYDQVRAATPPIPLLHPPPRFPPAELHPALRARFPSHDHHDESKRDSGVATMSSSTPTRVGEGEGEGEGSIRRKSSIISTVDESAHGIDINFKPTPSMASSLLTTSTSPVLSGVFVGKSDSLRSGSLRSPSLKMSRWTRKGSQSKPPNLATEDEEDFTPIAVPVPTESLIDQSVLDNMAFSKRGSMMLGGKKAVINRKPDGSRRQPSLSLLSGPLKSLPDDVDMESRNVRSLYEAVEGLDWRDGEDHAPAEHSESGALEPSSPTNGSLPLSTADRKEVRSVSSLTSRKEHELAGGVEDWEDIQGIDVDRYGFIQTRHTSPSRSSTPKPGPPQRVSTVLQLASDSPRRRRTFGRSASSAVSPGRRASARSFRSQTSTHSRRSTNRNGLRAAANRLPGNRDRRWMDEAGDMLTLPPGLAAIAEDAEGGKAAAALKKKEWERTEKWRKMAKVVKTGKDGQGMDFEFDTTSPKLIERTWKGIPDRWRASAWHSFLSSSAKKRESSVTDEQIVRAFHRLVKESCADDVQIDVDVPRTINCHIMFRRRYRGGQRLLFRVLHSLALYFPATGYVQGMASLAATLLCYFDEERAFIMLVRMWTLRGLDKLYAPGFSGLLSALDEFQTNWLDGNEVAQKLVELNIEPTTYGTRWFLTLFNYSIPFPAQLRVWDVFMLLGDADPDLTENVDRPFAGGLDIIHATGAALVDGTREILLDSDFESAMKVLTSWIPVKDEEMLMKVTKAEWKAHRGRERKKSSQASKPPVNTAPQATRDNMT